MIRRLILTPIRLAIVGWFAAWVADRVLRLRAGGTPPEPIHSLVVIDAPIEHVWEVLADIEGQPRWMAEMKSVRVVTPGPIRAGTQAEATVRILGLATTDPVTITEFQPPTRFAIAHEGSFTGQGVITLESGADGTTTIVRWDETLIPPALAHVSALAMDPVLRSIFQSDLFRLRDLIEADSGAARPAVDPRNDLPASSTV